jgi:hypothetical protein
MTITRREARDGATRVENNIYFPAAVALEDRAGQPNTFSDGCGHGCNH